MFNAIKSFLHRLRDALIQDDPYTDILSGSEIRELFGQEGYAAWRSAGAPLVTKSDFPEVGSARRRAQFDRTEFESTAEHANDHAGAISGAKVA